MARSARRTCLALAGTVLACWVLAGSLLTVSAADPAFVGVLALASDPAVAKELGLSEEVLKQLNELINKREDEISPLVLNKELPQEEKDAKMAEFAAESEKQGLKLLTAEQQAKLQQIRVRRVGPVVLLENAIADHLELTARQRGQLQTMHGFYELENATAPEAAKAKAKVEFEKKLLELLTAEQKTKWEALEGRTGAAVAQAAPADPDKPMAVKPVGEDPGTAKPPVTRPGTLRPGTPGPATVDPLRNSLVPPGGNTIPPGGNITLRPAVKGDPNAKLKFQFSYAPWKDVIQWFAEQADFSLVAETFPQGTFNYTDSTRTYSPSQALDLINKVLITKGYRLIRHERMLFLLSSDDELPDSFAPRISEAELDKQGDFEIVQCQFQLTKITAEEAALEVKTLLGLQGKVIVLSKARQLVVTDTVGALKQVRNALKSIENPETPKDDTLTIVKLEHIRPSEFMNIARDTEGIPAALNALPDGSLRISVDELGMRLFVTGKPEKIERINKLKALIDIESATGLEGGTILEQPQLEVYSVDNADPASAHAVLTTLLAGKPEVRISVDPKNGNIIAHCRPSEHATIRALLEQMQKDATKFVVFKLTKNDPQAIALQINELYGAGAINAPKVVADPTNLELSVRGSPAQIAQIEELLKGKGELGGGGTAANPTQRETVRIISNGTGRAALEAVQQVEAMWKAGLRPNNLIIHSRKKNVPAQLQNNLAPGAGSPTNAAPAGTRLRTLGEPQGPTLDPGSRNFLEENGLDPSEFRSAPPKAPAGPAPPPVAKPHVEPKAPANQTDPTTQRNSSTRAQFVSRQLPASETPEKKTTEPTAETPAAEPPAQPMGPVSKPGSDVLISMGPAGIILQSDDLDALDELEGRLRMIIDATNARGKEFHIMYLRHAKAQVVATLLQELISGTSSSGDTGGGGGGGGLMGDIASSMMGDMFGGLLGGLGGGGGGTSSAVSAGSAQITADIRLNALYIRANSRDLELIEDFIEVIDQPENPDGINFQPKPRFIPVKYSTADAIAAVVRQAYAGRLTADANAGGGQRQPSPQEFMQALRGGGRGGQQQQSKGEELKMTIGVDTRTNSLIVVAPDYMFNEVKALVEQLDVSELASDQIVRVYSLKSSNADVITRSVASVYGENITVTKTGTTSTTSTRPGGATGAAGQRPGGQQQRPPQQGGGQQGGGGQGQQQQGPSMQDILNAAQGGGGRGGGGLGGGGLGGGGRGGGGGGFPGAGGGGFGGGGRGGR